MNASLDRVVAKYRRDVHHLNRPASHDALRATERHLALRLPSGLAQFLKLNNGAVLFRGALRIRSTSELAAAHEHTPNVILFADQGAVTWGFAQYPGVGNLFGRWDGSQLVPVHSSFAGWLSGTIAVIESRVIVEADEESLRLQADPEDVVQCTVAGARFLMQGSPEQAHLMLAKTAKANIHWAYAWQLWGDALAITDRTAARTAWREAFEKTTLPVPFPGAPVLEPSALRGLKKAYSSEEECEEALARFLSDRVSDVVSEQGAELVSAVASALSKSLVARGQRRQAREVLSAMMAQMQRSTLKKTPFGCLLLLVELEIDLGHHDEAEALLRMLRRNGPPSLQARGQLLLAELATMRSEPWAEDIFNDARNAKLKKRDELLLRVYMAERFVRHQRMDRAASVVEGLIEEAAKRADRVLLAKAELVVADIKRHTSDEGVLALYESAINHANGIDAEVVYRVHLRLSDYAREKGDLVRAKRHARAAAIGFAEHELPVREAWALVRLARLMMSEDPVESHRWLKGAKERFLAADLAAGVATVDSLLGDPGQSLLWHLNRASDHARARHDAQLPKLPWERADADRPERRLGAHRLAVAACSDGVVKALSREMDAAVRATDTGRVRATDPAVMRYVAAVDLLSGHRSYEAARVLLSHLLENRVEGTARRALQGAVARSPNAALVDGLLRIIEESRSNPITAVTAAAEVLGLRRETSAIAPLMALATARTRPKARKAAVVALGRIGNRSVVEGIADCLQLPELAEASALALLMLGDRRGVDFHGRALLEGRTDLAGHPGEIVGRYGGPDHLLLLGNASKGDTEMALGALQGIGLLGDSRGVTYLLEALGTRNRRVIDVASMALTLLTGREDDPEEPGVRTRWNTFWDGEYGQFPEGVRHRYGEVFDAKWLIKRLDHVDPFTRRTAYDELVIMTGQTLPFDVDGPYRVQRAHRRAWQQWWITYGKGFKGGRWYLDGRILH